MALMISLIALSIDAMLPALSQMSIDLNIDSPNHRQWIVTALFLGLSIGQLFYGPLSDSFGRKRPVYLGLGIFIVGTLVSMLSTGFEWMLAGRFLQGIGAASPRIVTLALVRDQYAGRQMARVMSLVMAVFILVPALAPALGQGILWIADWRAIFGMLLFQGVLMLTWFGLRQPETLALSKRKPFTLSFILQSASEVIRHRASLGYTLASAAVFGAFLGYLTSAQQIFQGIYLQGDKFPLYFALLALFVGGASFVNSRLVMHFGLHSLARLALWILALISTGFILVVWLCQPSLPLWLFMSYMSGAFFCVGILFGNLNTLALEPMGHIAGTASAVVSALSSLLSLPVGAFIGSQFNDTVAPLIAGFTVLAWLALGFVYMAEKPFPTISRQDAPPSVPAKPD
ncbi:MAG: multidrug effflux MFS transporter [Hahellaceae bacterium]|nr:multidrug effflux MFS transporter [Hahellaceae bacterium]MCP5169955.1 multidrug effflux MFS transporter [Hahellaceae bacterium]